MMLETMRSALATGRAQAPVAARLHVELPGDQHDLDRELALGGELLSQLFKAPIAEFTAFGSKATRGRSGLIRFSCGQSALVAIAGEADRLRVECTVFAACGTLRWESDHDDNTPADAWAGSLQLSDTTLAWLEQFRARSTGAQLVESRRPFPHSIPPKACRPPYGVLLVAGDHTHQPGYAAALAADPRCHLVAVADEANVEPRRREKNELLADRLGIPYLADLDAALVRDDIQIVSVCAEPYRRGAIIVKAARAGKHLYLDKPLCATQAEAEAIVAAVREARVVAHMFSQVGFAPALKARRCLASGRLGELQAIHADLCFAKGHAGTATLGVPRVESAQPARFELIDAKRELTNVGVYPVVLLLWLTRRRVRRVVAATGNYFFAEHQANDMEDFGQILLEFDGGLTATISAGRVGWQSHPSSGLHRTILVGDNNVAFVDAHRPRVEQWSAAEAWQPPERNPEDPLGMWQAPPDDPFQARPKLDWIVPGNASWQLDTGHFLDCIEQGRVSDVPVELAALATEVLLAAYRSAATGEVVEL